MKETRQAREAASYQQGARGQKTRTILNQLHEMIMGDENAPPAWKDQVVMERDDKRRAA